MAICFSPLVHLQSTIQSLRVGIRDGRAAADLYAEFQDVFHQGQSYPTLKPFLRNFTFPSLAGPPSYEALRGMADQLEALLEPAPIGRSDPIAQNSHVWAARSAIRQGNRKVVYKILDQRADVMGTFIATALRDGGDRVAAFFKGNRTNVFEISLACRRPRARPCPAR